MLKLYRKMKAANSLALDVGLMPGDVTIWFHIDLHTYGPI